MNIVALRCLRRANQFAGGRPYSTENQYGRLTLSASEAKAVLTFQLFVVLEPKVFQKTQSPQGLRDVSGQVVLV